MMMPTFHELSAQLDDADRDWMNEYKAQNNWQDEGEAARVRAGEALEAQGKDSAEYMRWFLRQNECYRMASECSKAVLAAKRKYDEILRKMASLPQQ